MAAGNFGARVIAPGQVRFRLWAPGCERVDLLLRGQEPRAMTPEDDGVFEILTDCEPGALYKYRVSETLAVPDPASHAQSRDVHDESVVVDHSYPWTANDWRGRPWTEAVIYELHAGAFGGFNGIKAHLPRLAELGFTAVQLMPIADFPGRHNWGYDGVLPYAPDAAYGSPFELKELIDTAHALGLQVFLDVVYNHFGPDGNYLSAYAPDFFNEDIQTPWGAAINFKMPQVRRFFIENAVYWLQDYRFDGLRFDAVHAIKDDGFLLEMAAEIKLRFADRHVHLILENENNDSRLLNEDGEREKFDGQWTDDWHHCLHVLLTGESEGYYEDFQNPAAQLARCLREGFAYQGDASAHAGGAARGTPSGHLPPTSFVICLQNHDQIGNRAFGERLASLTDQQKLRAAIVLLLMTPQIPMVFMGEEIGETRPFLFFTDHHDDLADAVREGRRKEFSKFAAFADPARRSKIPDPNAASTFDMSVPIFQEADGNETSALYARCLAARRDYLMPHIPGARSVGASAIAPEAVTGQWRLGNGNFLTIAANFGSEPVPFEARGDILVAAGTPYDGTALPACSAIVWLETP